jgi:hypothetical protein
MHVPSALLSKYRLNIGLPLSRKRDVSSAKGQTHTTCVERRSDVASNGEISVALKWAHTTGMRGVPDPVAVNAWHLLYAMGRQKGEVLKFSSTVRCQ